MAQTENIELIDYLKMLWRRKWLLLTVVLSVLVVAAFIIKKLPVVYRSTGTILIERQDIPEQWVNSTITSFAEERIQSIGQKVLTTDKLGLIIEKFGLFEKYRERLTFDELASLARDNFTIENVRRVGANNNGTAAFRISYQDPSAQTARDVASELIQLYLGENKRSRTQAATDTRRFLEDEADRLEWDLKSIEQEISKFKEINMGILPENQDINIQAYERVEQQIASVDRTLMSLEDRQIVIESSIASARRILYASRASDGASIVTPRQRLNELQTQHASLQTRYSSSHPDLKRLIREIELLQSELAADSASKKFDQDDTAIIQLKSDLKSTIHEQKSLRQSKIDLAKKLDTLEDRISKTPAVELEYRTLIRDHENIQNKYNDIRSKQNSARVSQSLEEEQKGERFTLIEAPRLASRPHSPNYSKMYVMALGLAFLCGIGAVLGMESLDGTVRDARALNSLTGAPLLAEVGYIENLSDRRSRGYKRFGLLITFILILSSAGYLLKYYQIEVSELQPGEILQGVRQWINSLILPR